MQRSAAPDFDAAVRGRVTSLDPLDSLDCIGLGDGCQHRNQRIVGVLCLRISPLVLRHGTRLAPNARRAGSWIECTFREEFVLWEGEDEASIVEPWDSDRVTVGRADDAEPEAL